MRKQWKILGAVYLAINTLFLIPVVQYSLTPKSLEEALRGPVYTIPFYGDIMEWYSRMQLTGVHGGLALFFVIFCVKDLDLSKRHNKVIMGLLICLLIVNICFNMNVIFRYMPDV